MPNLFRFLLGCFLFSLLACEGTPPTALTRTSALDADAGEEPASWEGDWTWEDPVTTDACHPVDPIDAGPAVDTTPSPLVCHGEQLRISASSGLIPNCDQGLIIHAWDEDGDEFLSPPDQSLTLNLRADTLGWIAFNVTCGTTWVNAVDWRQYLTVSLDESGLIAASSGGHALTPRVKLCPYAIDGTIIPVIPLTCDEDPC